MEVVFSSLFFCFQSFSINISSVLKFVDFKWCEEWVVAF